LVFDESVRGPVLRPLHGHEAFRWLKTSLFRVVIDEPDVDASDFAKIAQLNAAAPVFELRRRRSLAEMHEGADVLMAALAPFQTGRTTP
jgi:hypothetical protein